MCARCLVTRETELQMNKIVALKMNVNPLYSISCVSASAVWEESVYSENRGRLELQRKRTVRSSALQSTSCRCRVSYNAPRDYFVHHRAEGGRRRGYMGHLTRIANSIVHNSDKGPNGPQIQQLLSGEAQMKFIQCSSQVQNNWYHSSVLYCYDWCGCSLFKFSGTITTICQN